MADYREVPGAQVTDAEREAIKGQAKRSAELKDHPVIVNIGIMWGCTLWCLRAGAPDADLYGVDITPDKWKIEDREDLQAVIIQGDSRTLEFDKPIDLLLIDGDHHYDVVSKDIENWVRRVVPGGTVILHDYNPTEHNMKQFPELEGVKRAVDELMGDHPNWIDMPAPDSLRILVTSMRRSDEPEGE